MEKVFNKLVRDKIPEIIEKNNEHAETRVLNEEEYRLELYKKLLEEANEVISAKSSDEILEELADTLEVLSSIAHMENKTIEDVIELSRQKKEKRGGFEKRILLIKTYGVDDK